MHGGTFWLSIVLMFAPKKYSATLTAATTKARSIPVLEEPTEPFRSVGPLAEPALAAVATASLEDHEMVAL